MSRIVWYSILTCFISLGLSSCSFHRKVAGRKARSIDSTIVTKTDTTQPAIAITQVVPSTKDTAVPVVNDSSLVVKKLIEELTPLSRMRLEYRTFSGKAKVNFEGPSDKQEFTAHFRVRKDSIIWIAITGLGGMVSVARICVTPDSFIMVNQLQKEVTRLPLREAAKVLPAKTDFSSLQNLITGDPLRGGVITDASAFGGAWSIQVEDSSYIQRITYNKVDSTMRTAQLRTRDPRGPQAIMNYGNYFETNINRKVSTSRAINIQNGPDSYSIDMNFQNTDFNLPLDFPFSIPKTYTVKQPH